MQLLTLKQAKQTIKLIATAGEKLDERIHLVAVSGLAHFQDHGDTTAITELSKAMPKSARGNRLKQYIQEFAPVKWDSKAFEGTGGFVIKKAGIDRAVDLETAMQPTHLISQIQNALQSLTLSVV